MSAAATHIAANAAMPAPVRNAESTPFFAAAADGRLLVRRCAACARLHWYPRPVCPFCHGPTEWQQVSGRGRIHTFSIYGGKGEPYVLACVELDEGPMLLTNLVNCATDALRIGAPVQVCFQPAVDGTAIACFTPV